MPRKQPILIARFFVFLFAMASAPTAAMGLYALGHDAMGIAPHFIMIVSSGAAGFLILLYLYVYVCAVSHLDEE